MARAAASAAPSRPPGRSRRAAHFAAASDGRAPGADRRPRFGVGGVVAHGGGNDGSNDRRGFDALPPPIGDGGEPTLLVALGLLVALALLVRRELSRR